ncbi:hypothetical protein [Streptomyces sediminimaris]|uniref:hypothetical protein n=1 Tax=Streptomyces sediminimaris TaxID=3383721 RepID=UPI00399B0787
MITGPATLYLLSRRKRRESDGRDRYDELSQKYTELLEQSTAGELPNGRGRYPEDR